MSQSFHTFITTDTFGNLYTNLNNAFEAVRSCFIGTSAPSSVTAGQLWINSSTSPYSLYVYTGSAWTAITDYLPSFLSTQNEVEAARGSADDLDARLSVALNDDGTLKGTAPASDWWTAEGDAVAYVSSTSFTVSGNKTAIYTAFRAVKLTQTSSGVAYVSTSTYSSGTGLTTVVTFAGVSVDSGLSAVAYGQPNTNQPYLPEYNIPHTQVSKSASFTISPTNHDTTFYISAAATVTQGSTVPVAGNRFTFVNTSSTATVTLFTSSQSINGTACPAYLYAGESVTLEVVSSGTYRTVGGSSVLSAMPGTLIGSSTSIQTDTITNNTSTPALVLSTSYTPKLPNSKIKIKTIAGLFDTSRDYGSAEVDGAVYGSSYVSINGTKTNASTIGCTGRTDTTGLITARAPLCTEYTYTATSASAITFAWYIVSLTNNTTRIYCAAADYAYGYLIVEEYKA